MNVEGGGPCEGGWSWPGGGIGGLRVLRKTITRIMSGRTKKPMIIKMMTNSGAPMLFTELTVAGPHGGCRGD